MKRQRAVVEQSYRQRENDSGKPDHARRPWLTRGTAHVLYVIQK